MQIYNYFICVKCIAEINSHEGNEVSQRLTRDMLNMNSEQDREREPKGWIAWRNNLHWMNGFLITFLSLFIIASPMLHSWLLCESMQYDVGREVEEDRYNRLLKWKIMIDFNWISRAVNFFSRSHLFLCMLLCWLQLTLMMTMI